MTGAVAALELAVLRGPRPKPGTEGLIHALKNFRAQRGTLYRSDPRKQLSDAELDLADELARRLAAALAPLEKLPRATASFPEIAVCHRKAVEELSTGKDGKVAAFAGADGNALALAFDEIAEHAAAASFGMTPADYPDFFRAAISDRVVRRPDRPGTRVHIYGLLEARLQNVDRLVLGGLVEGVWPPETRSDPWLNRPMRHELGLDLPERRIGLSAHDFAQSLGAKEVILTRAAKLSGAPTVASRFTQRLQAVAGEERWKAGAGARRQISALGARARSAGDDAEIGCRARSRSRWWSCARNRSRSPRSSSCCAILTRSMRAMFCACSRSMRSIRRRARATAAR